MNVRCELNIGGSCRRILLAVRPEETQEHVALRLAAAVLFFTGEPALEVGPGHPAVGEYGFFPDLLVSDAAGNVGVWIECGTVALNKISKVARRLTPGARFVILKESPEDGKRQRKVLEEEVREAKSVEVLAWPRAEFARWKAAITESNQLFGEAENGNCINLVLNDQAFCVDMLVC